MKCENCGEDVMASDYYRAFNRRKVYVCGRSECSVALERDEGEALEMERQGMTTVMDLVKQLRAVVEEHEYANAGMGYSRKTYLNTDKAVKLIAKWEAQRCTECAKHSPPITTAPAERDET